MTQGTGVPEGSAQLQSVLLPDIWPVTPQFQSGAQNRWQVSREDKTLPQLTAHLLHLRPCCAGAASLGTLDSLMLLQPWAGGRPGLACLGKCQPVSGPLYRRCCVAPCCLDLESSLDAIPCPTQEVPLTSPPLFDLATSCFNFLRSSPRKPSGTLRLEQGPPCPLCPLSQQTPNYLLLSPLSQLPA